MPGPYIVVLAALVPLAWAQIASKPMEPAGVAPASPFAAPPAGGFGIAPSKIPLRALYPLERASDDKLRTIGEPNTMDVLGATRGVYLDGYGAVFTSEISLATGPALYAFHQTITPQEKAGTHQKMVQRLPVLRTVAKEMVRSLAASLPGIPDNQQIVLAVRLDYTSWEDTSGLPGLLMVKADRKSAMAGNVVMQEE